LGIAFRFFREKFQCDVAAEFAVLSLVDHAHAAAAELSQNLVVSNGLVDHGSLNDDGNRSRKGGQCAEAALRTDE
jgi:hypothetical protein